MCPLLSKAQGSFSDRLSSVCKPFTSSSQNHWANFNLTKHPWVEGVQVSSNEGLCPFPKGDNHEIKKKHWWNLWIFVSSTTEPISTKLVRKHPWMKGIQFFSNEGPHPFPRGDNYKKSRNTMTKIFLQNNCSNFNQTNGKTHPWMKGFQICSNEGPSRFSLGDNYKKVKIY